MPAVVKLDGRPFEQRPGKAVERTVKGRLSLVMMRRLLLMLLLPPALLAAVVGAQYLEHVHQSPEPGLHERGLAIVTFLAPAAEYGVASMNPRSLDSLLQGVHAQHGVVATAIYDRAGIPIATRGKAEIAEAGRLTHVGSAQVIGEQGERVGIAAPVVRNATSMTSSGSNARSGRTSGAARPIGWVYIELDASSVLAQHRQNTLVMTLILAVATLALTTLAALRLMRSFAHARADMEEAIDEVTEVFAYQAMHDPLTGLPNRRAFEEALEQAVSASRRVTDQDSLCFLDLDHFKMVNDNCGHAAGDELLREVARVLRQRLRSQDMICRIGGDEFALILHACTPEDARRIATDLCTSVSELVFEWEGRRYHIGASIGLARIDHPIDSAADVLLAADRACYAAKHKGRNRVVEHRVTPSP